MIVSWMRALAIAHRDLEVADRADRLQRLEQGRAVAGGLHPEVELVAGAAAHLGDGVSGQRLQRRVAVDEAAVGEAGDADRDRRGAKDLLEALLRSAQRLLGLLALGDVGGDAAHAAHLAGGIEDGKLQLEEGALAAAVGIGRLELERPALLDDAPLVGRQRLRIRRRDQRQLPDGVTEHLGGALADSAARTRD